MWKNRTQDFCHVNQTKAVEQSSKSVARVLVDMGMRFSFENSDLLIKDDRCDVEIEVPGKAPWDTRGDLEDSRNKI